MKVSRPFAPALALAVLAGACHSAQPPSQPQPQNYQYEPSPQEKQVATQEFEAYSSKFLDWYYTSHPVRATELGIHEGDGQLPDMSGDGVQHRIDSLLDWLQKQDTLQPGMLELPDQVDFRIIEYAIRAELLDLEEIQAWAHQPGFYLDEISRGVNSLLSGDSTEHQSRVRNMTARLESVPEVLVAARKSLTQVPAPWAREGAREAHALAAYLRVSVRSTFDGRDDADALLRSQFDGALDRAATALDAFGDWLETSVLPQATGDYHLGRYIFLRELQYREHLRLTAAELNQLSRNAIDDLRGQIQKVATEIDPGRTTREILDSLATDTLSADSTRTAAQEDLSAALRFVAAKDLVALPNRPLPTLRVPPAGRPASLIGLQTAGPLDTTRATAYLTVPPHMDRKSLELFIIRTTMPGAFVQRQYAADSASAVRRTFEPRSLREGWGLYAEQLMVDEGFATDDPGLRLMQLQRALERQARWYAAVRIHAFDESIDEVTDSFPDIAYVDADSARREVVRATYDPTWFSDALGRLQVIELRRAYHAYLDADKDTQGSFNLASFHEKFLKLALPAPLARLLLMPRRRQPRQGDGRRGPPPR